MNKACSCCKNEKPLSEFNKNKSNKDGYQCWCKGCRRSSYIKNRELVLFHSKKWYQENKEVKQTYDKDRRERIGDTLRLYDRIRSSTPNRRALANLSTAKRRAKHKQATVGWESELTAFVSKEAFLLAKDREGLLGGKWHVDHIIPLNGKTVCGLHVWNNFQVIPAIQNILKSNHFEVNI